MKNKEKFIAKPDAKQGSEVLGSEGDKPGQFNVTWGATFDSRKQRTIVSDRGKGFSYSTRTWNMSTRLVQRATNRES